MSLFAIASFFSAFVIAFFKQWKFALILCCIVPTIIAIFGIGGTLMTKYAKLSVTAYADASTLAEEIISSVRTAQAFGTQEKLSNLYDESLVAAQKAGYKQQLTGAIMIAAMFWSVYAFYGLGFCTSRKYHSNCRARIPNDSVWRYKRWYRCHCHIVRHDRCILPCHTWSSS